jgi:hypothetical protein
MRGRTLGEEPLTETKVAPVTRKCNAPKVLCANTEVIDGHQCENGSRVVTCGCTGPRSLAVQRDVSWGRPGENGRTGHEQGIATHHILKKAPPARWHGAFRLHLKCLSPSSIAPDLQWRPGWGTLLTARRSRTAAGAWHSDGVWSSVFLLPYQAKDSFY